MKKQILVFSALIIMAAFFTACEQEAIINPVDDIVQLETSEKPPQEALDQLQVLIDNDFSEIELKSSCEDSTFPYSLGFITDKNPSPACNAKFDLFGTTVEVFGGFQPPKGWFYFHTDELKLNGRYINIDSGMKYGSTVEWKNKQYTSHPIFSGCKYRAYVYLWDPGCGVWERLAVKYFN